LPILQQVKVLDSLVKDNHLQRCGESGAPFAVVRQGYEGRVCGEQLHWVVVRLEGRAGHG
jgi:hypothetical protein